MTAIFIGCAIVGLIILGLAIVIGEILEGLFEAIDSDIFSPLSLGSSTSIFGLTGLGLLEMAINPIGALLGAVAAAAIAAIITVKVMHALMKSDSRDSVSSAELVGLAGHVVTDIPADGYGTIKVLASGHDTRLNAKANKPIESGQKVRVVEVLSPTSVRVED